MYIPRTSRNRPLDRLPPGGAARATLGLSVSVAGLMALSSPALAEVPPAGTIIGNQAIATFSDGVTTRSVTSNLVQTQINQVYGVSIEEDQTKTAAVDGLVTFPHTITNTGNGSDRFAVTAIAASGVFDGITIYADADCDGAADSATLLSETPFLAPGEQFCVVVEGDLAASVGVGDDVASLTVTATSFGGDNTPDPSNDATDSNTDTISVTAGPVLDLTKSIVFAPGGDVDNSESITPGDILTVRLTYANRQPNTDATAFIVDNLDSASLADLSLVPGSFVWSDGGTLDENSDRFTQDVSGISGVFDTPPDDTNGSGENIDVYYDSTTREVQIGVDINSGSQTRSGYVEFQVEVGSAASGTSFNVATIDTVPSNQVPITIAGNDAIALVLNDRSSTLAAYANRSVLDLADSGGTWAGGGAIISATDTDVSGNNIASGDDIIAFGTTVAEGAVVPFQVVLTNHSNTAERFNLSAIGSPTTFAGGQAFPAATSFTFYTASGSPLLDVDGNGAPDILVGANSALALEVRADLPLGFTADTPATGGTDPVPAALVTATSSSNVDVFNSTVIQLTGGVQGASVDLENAGGLADGPELNNASGEPWTVAPPINPGETASFTLVVENTSLAADSYNLSFIQSSVAPVTLTGTLPGTLPENWSVVFRNAGGAIVTNTGLLAPGAAATFTGIVTVPAGEAPGDYDLYFRATSATNDTVLDTKRDRVVVREVADLTITPDRQGQLSAGGALVLSHTLTNVGNVTVTEGALVFSQPFLTLVESLYLDTNGDGILQLDGTDTLIGNVSEIDPSGTPGLAPGESVTIFNRIQASSAAVAGLSESAVITVAASLNGGSNTDANADNNAVTDIVTIVAGDLEVLKVQALDADCNGAPDGAFTINLLNADPGQCIVYRVTAENTGTVIASDVQIIDTTPAFTTLAGAPAPSPLAEGGDAPAMDIGTVAAGAAGDVISTHGTLQPGSVATLTFTVEIDSN